MRRPLADCSRAMLVVLLLGAAAAAQNLAQSSVTPENSGDQPVGQDISSDLERFSQASPEMQQAQELRDTQTRGTFVGAEAGESADFLEAEQESRVRTAQERGGTARRRRSTQPRRTQKPQFRYTIVVAFDYTPKVSPEVGKISRASLARIPTFGNTSSIRARVEKNVVILEGTVATEHDSQLALQMVALEPGVVKVDNRLKVLKAVQ